MNDHKFTLTDRESVHGFLTFLRQNRLTVEDAMQKYERPPVDIATFINSTKFLNKRGIIYPAVMRELVECNNGSYVEAVFTGGIGSGKTTGALYTNAYQLYLLSCMRNTHRQFGLDEASEILFIFQNKTEALAKDVDFARFKAMIDSSTYFRECFPFNPKVRSRLVFPGRIEVVPVSGQETAAIGQNVMGGLIDELNYMQVVEKSKRSVDVGTYDQAVAIYNSIARRRKSRFMLQGKLPGILCLVSSRRYPGQFTDQKEQEAKSDPTIFVYDKCSWEVKPDAYSGDTFPVFIGDLGRRPRILSDDDAILNTDPDLVRNIPEEHRAEFENDIINALREIAGVSTLARFPFFMNQEKVRASFGRRRSVLSEHECDMVTRKVRIFRELFENPEEKRYVHVDLGLTGDSAGVACGYVPKFVLQHRDGVYEKLPEVHIDFTLRVNPPRGGEISFEKIRTLFYKLRDLGLNIEWISFDSFQSRDSIQILRQRGFRTGQISVDKDTVAYDLLKGCMYDGRLHSPMHEFLIKELMSLERIPMKDKVDHPENGSKDVADALAGVVYGLSTRRDVYARHDIPLHEVPESIREHVVKTSKKESVRPMLEAVEDAA